MFYCNGGLFMGKFVSLESEAEKVCNKSAIPPLIFQLSPVKGREVLENAQSIPVFMCPANIHCVQVRVDSNLKIPVYMVAPKDCQSIKSIIFYIHGGGWVFGSFHTHEKLVRELAYRTNSILIFPEYTRSPEVKFPVAIEQCYHVLCMLPELIKCQFPAMNWDALMVAGDSVGGNMAIAMALLAKERCGPNIHKQLLYYPVTDSYFQTASYLQFASGYYLYREGMMWFWNQYAPVLKNRCNILLSPLKAAIDQLHGLPDALIINGEADVLRDEGEAFVKKLRRAGVDVTAVRLQGIIHDFVTLNTLDQTNACRTAMDISTAWINRKNNF